MIIQNITANGTTQASGTPIPSTGALTVVLVTTNISPSPNTAVVLPSTVEIGRGIEVYVTGSYDADVFPASGHSIGDYGVDTSVASPKSILGGGGGGGGGRLFRRMTATTWQVTFG